MWTCLKCRTSHEDQFDSCWNCGANRDGTAVPETEWVPQQAASAPQAADPAPCAKCGSEKVIPDVRLISNRDDFWNELRLRVDRNPGALFLRDSFFSGVTARVCGNCGHTELAALDPEGLWDAYQQRLRTSKSG